MVPGLRCRSCQKSPEKATHRCYHTLNALGDAELIRRLNEDWNDGYDPSWDIIWIAEPSCTIVWKVYPLQFQIVSFLDLSFKKSSHLQGFWYQSVRICEKWKPLPNTTFLHNPFPRTRRGVWMVGKAEKTAGILWFKYFKCRQLHFQKLHLPTIPWSLYTM